jgi:hypothetical protein
VVRSVVEYPDLTPIPIKNIVMPGAKTHQANEFYVNGFARCRESVSRWIPLVIGHICRVSQEKFSAQSKAQHGRRLSRQNSDHPPIITNDAQVNEHASPAML